MISRTIAPNALPTVGKYRIDPVRSTVTYSGRHLFGLGVVHATFRIRSGQIQIADPYTASAVAVSIDASSFASGNASRDKAVRSAALLDTAAFAEISFTSDNLRWDGDNWLLNGCVTAHGVTVPADVTFDSVVHEPRGIRVLCRADHLDRYAFGVSGSKGMVGRHLDLDIDIYATP
jgi:polyisoprenoid-binding protein YceI